MRKHLSLLNLRSDLGTKLRSSAIIQRAMSLKKSFGRENSNGIFPRKEETGDSWSRKVSGAKTSEYRERREPPFKAGRIVTRCKRLVGIEDLYLGKDRKTSDSHGRSHPGVAK